MVDVGAFDAALTHAVRSDAPMPTLADLMARTLKRTGSDHLAVTTLMSDVGEPGLALADAAGKALIEHLPTRSGVSVLRVGTSLEPYLVSLWPSGQPSIWHVVSTVPVTDKRWKRVERWVRRAAPRVAPVYLDADTIPAICAQLSEKGPVLASRMTARITFDGSSYNRGWRESGPVSRPSFREALEEVEGRGTVRTLTVTVGEKLNVHLRRTAGSTYYGGDPHLFVDSVLVELARAARQKSDVFRDRQRVKHQPLGPPILIRVDDDHFDEPSRLQELVQALDSTPDLSVAVLHGNPYLHVAVTDFRDGSNYDVLVTETNRITVYPGFQASLGSLARMTESISEGVASEDIGLSQPREQFGLADFFAQS